MIRIITGKFKGKQLQVPDGTKPITDRIKTSLFDLVHDYLTPETKVLDLFSGSGNFALEALSRGAEQAVMVDKGDLQCQIISENINSLGVKTNCEIRKQDAISYLRSESRKFELIMLDPPFPFLIKKKSELLELSLPLLSDDGILIFRFPSVENYDPQNYLPYKEAYRQKYGLSTVSFYRKK